MHHASEHACAMTKRKGCRAWNVDGWLSPYNIDKTFSGVLGYMDYAGGTVVHTLGGAAALVAVFVLGPRHGRFGIDGEVVELEGVVVRNSMPPRMHANPKSDLNQFKRV
jgi:ammonia channel protein AmtB